MTLPRGSLAPSREKAVLPAPALKRGRLLLVEDVEVNRKLARIILEVAGHTVGIAPDGPTAIAAMHDGDFDLVLMDVQMPGMDGMEATRVIRGLADERSRIPIVAMTANVLPHQVRQFRAAGMDDHVGKSIDRAELLAVIERWLTNGPVSHRAAGPGQAEAVPGIDQTSFDQLLRLVGADSTREIVRSFRSELETCFSGDCAAPGDRVRIRREAHALSIIPRSGPRSAEKNDAKSRKSKQAFVGRPTNACLVPVSSMLGFRGALRGHLGA